jgi:hypothetical protein
MAQQALARVLHDAGAAAWFGGALMGMSGLDAAAAAATDPKERIAAAGAGWRRWMPLQAAAIAAHLAGGAMLVSGNKGRLTGQRGVASTATLKTALTGAALAATVGAVVIGRRLGKEGRVPVTAPTTPNDETPPDVARLQRRERLLQIAVPALTGAVVVLSAVMGEQQRPTAVATGFVARAASLPTTVAHLAAEVPSTVASLAAEVPSTLAHFAAEVPSAVSRLADAIG